jgi:hypothetical protein
MEQTKAIIHAGIEWDVLSYMTWTPYVREYCADGDGIVRVSERAKGCFKGFLVFDQMDYMGKHDTLEAALDHAAQILKTVYPEIYEIHYQGEEA